MTVEQPAKTKKIKLPDFLRRNKLATFLTIVMSGQIMYSAFEAFKGSLMLQIIEVLGITKTEYGILMGWIGISMFLYVPCGWINNRVKVRTLMFWSLGARLISTLVLYNLPVALDNPSFDLPYLLSWISPDGISLRFLIMVLIAMLWGVLDAIMWPAVINGISIAAGNKEGQGKGLAMSLFEGIRRCAEFLMNLLIIGIILAFENQANTVMWCAAMFYALLIVPMMYCVWKYVPDTEIAKEEGHGHSMSALIGLGRMLLYPQIWLGGLAALAVYWTYINLMYCSAPYLAEVFHISEGLASLFGIVNTGAVGIIGSLLAGLCADYVFKSSAKMMAVALGLIGLFCFLVIVMPETSAMLWPTLLLLMVMSFCIFMAKSLLLAPIAELNLPEGISGSGMAIGSFMGYASVFWGYALNGAIIDAHPEDPSAGYHQIFLITLGCAILGAACAVILSIWNARVAKNKKASEAAATA